MKLINKNSLVDNEGRFHAITELFEDPENPTDTEIYLVERNYSVDAERLLAERGKMEGAEVLRPIIHES